MTNRNQNQEFGVVRGRVANAYPYREDKPSAPAKLVIDTDDGGTAEVAFFNAWDDFENRVPASPPRLGKVWGELDASNPVGRLVQIIAVEDGSYEGRARFKSAKSVRFIDGAPAPEPASAAPAPAARATPIDGARWGNTLNNSTLVNVNVPLEQQAAVWEKILRDAAWLYQLTSEDIAGFLKSDEDEPEIEVQDDDDSDPSDAVLGTV